MTYKDTVDQIKALPWSQLSACDLEGLMVISARTGMEFARSLRTVNEALDHPAIATLAREELNADNLSFEDYSGQGDHNEFLWHFIHKYDVMSTKRDRLYRDRYFREYDHVVRMLPVDTLAQTIVSRERQLPGIFEAMLQAPDWDRPSLQAFRHYLVQHIKLDSQEGGHADMLAEFPVTEAVAPFYNARLALYTRTLIPLYQN